MQILYKIGSVSNFSDLTYSEEGLILKYKNRSDQEIDFSEVEQIYIKRYNLHPVIELACIGAPFLLTFLVEQYTASEILTLASLFTIPTVLISVINCKWYRFIIRLKNGRSFSKKVSNFTKTENVLTLEKVCSKILYYKASGLLST
jgi:Na+/H+-dicarboxylate symporter